MRQNSKGQNTNVTKYKKTNYKYKKNAKKTKRLNTHITKYKYDIIQEDKNKYDKIQSST